MWPHMIMSCWPCFQLHYMQEFMVLLMWYGYWKSAPQNTDFGQIWPWKPSQLSQVSCMIYFYYHNGGNVSMYVRKNNWVIFVHPTLPKMAGPPGQPCLGPHQVFLSLNHSQTISPNLFIGTVGRLFLRGHLPTLGYSLTQPSHILRIRHLCSSASAPPIH